MRITNELIRYRDQYYARITVVKGEMVPAGTIWRSTNGYYYQANTLVSGWSDSDLLYVPVVVPNGYVVLKDNDEISKDTLFYSASTRRFEMVGDHAFGKYSEVCEAYPLLESVLMFNPLKTPQQYYADAEKYGTIEAWKSGKEIESSEDGKSWTVNKTPNFSLPLQWRTKVLPITPPKFDWRPIIDGQEPKVCVLVMSDVNPKTITTGGFVGGMNGWEDYSGKKIFPTHYTTLE